MQLCTLALVKVGFPWPDGAAPAGEQLRADVINSQMLQEHGALPSNWENLGTAGISGCLIHFMALQRQEMLQKAELQTAPSLREQEKHLWGDTLGSSLKLPYLGDNASSFRSSRKLPKMLPKPRSGVEVRRRKSRLILPPLNPNFCLPFLPSQPSSFIPGPGRVIPEGSSLGTSFLCSSAAFVS